ncbi:hypothetical protein GCM10027400_12600 [Pseudoxanthomonas daejeonensis]|uniref:Transmembrane protein n=2 Tax=Pseudoxanthomonas daejeonensis TaxID=266062 RepID=A0ABQ6Z7L2_9GAMM|nr:hypothetical protein CSC65_07345 [Pseudoxanthomonas daejeonensis]
MTMPAPLLFSLRVFLCLVMAASVALAIRMARPWGDNYAYQEFSGYVGLGMFMLWAILPLAALAWAARWFRHARIASWVYAIGACGIALSGLYVYVDAALIHIDPQGGLVFMFVPLVQWGAALGLAAVCAVVRRVAR